MHALLCRELKRPYKHQGFMLSRINIRLHITSKGDRHGPSYRQQKQMPLNGHTEATAMPMAFHLLPVAAYTGAATITPCKNDQLGWALREMLQEQKSEGSLPVRRRDCMQSPSIRRWCCHHIRLTRAAKASRCCYTSRNTQ